MAPRSTPDAPDEPVACPRLLTADQLAAELGCSRSHVFEMASKGRIPSYRIGHAVRFDLAEVLAASRQGVAS